MNKITKRLLSLAFLLSIVPAILAQRVLPSEPAPLPAYVYAIAVILIFAIVILIVTHIKSS